MVDTVVMNIPFNNAVMFNYSRFKSVENVSRLIMGDILRSPNTIPKNQTTQETSSMIFSKNNACKITISI